eukprot:gene12463-biopygen16328
MFKKAPGRGLLEQTPPPPPPPVRNSSSKRVAELESLQQVAGLDLPSAGIEHLVHNLSSLLIMSLGPE